MFRSFKHKILIANYINKIIQILCMFKKEAFTFSVILYLKEEIEKPIENIINQTIDFSEIQLILMTKNCSNACLNYDSTFENILYLYDIDESDALRVGYSYSNAEYLFFMNENDFLELDALAIAKKFIINNNNLNIIILNHIIGNLDEFIISKNHIIDFDDYKPKYLYLNSVILKRSHILNEFFENESLFLIYCLSNVEKIGLLNSTFIFSRKMELNNLILNIELILDDLIKNIPSKFPNFLQSILLEYFGLIYNFRKVNNVNYFITNFLQHIDEENIIFKDLDKFIKMDLLSIKSNKKLVEKKHDNNHILMYNDIILDEFIKNNTLFIDSVSIAGNILEIKGKFYSCFNNENIIIKGYNKDLKMQTETELIENPVFNHKSMGVSFKSICELKEDINSIDFRLVYKTLVYTPILNYEYVDCNQKEEYGFFDLSFFEDSIKIKDMRNSFSFEYQNISNKKDINNEIFTLWVSDDDSLPELSYLALKSMLLVGHDVTLYTYKHLKNIPDGVNVVDANTILDESKIFKYKHGHKTYSGFANLFRLKRLYEYGGIWLDLDIILIRNINDLVPEKISICSEPHRDFFFFNNNAFLKFPKHDPCIKYMLDYAERRGDDVYHGETGPKLVQKVLTENFIEYNKYLKSPNVNNFFGWWDIKKFFEDTDIVVNNFDFSEIVGFHLTNTFFTKLDLEKYPPSGFYKDLKDIIINSSTKEEYINKLNQIKVLDDCTHEKINFFNSNYLDSIEQRHFEYSFLIDSKNLSKIELYNCIDSISRYCSKPHEIIVFNRSNMVKESLPKNKNILFLNQSFESIKFKIIEFINGDKVIPINKPIMFREGFFEIFNDYTYFNISKVKFAGVNKIDNLKVFNKNIFKKFSNLDYDIFNIPIACLSSKNLEVKEFVSDYIISLETEKSSIEKIIVENIDALKNISTDSEFNIIKNKIEHNFSEDMSLKLSYFYYKSCLVLLNSSNLKEFLLKLYVDDLENFIFEMFRNSNFGDYHGR